MSAKYLVLGSGGMLGSEICKLLDERGEPYETVKLSTFDHDWIYRVQRSGAEVIINCAGALKDASYEDQLYINGRVPALLNEHFTGGRVAYVSTDCVFSGRHAELNTIHSIPDPIDTYGATKRLGELSSDLVIRTSFIGLKHGLLRWAIQQRGERVGGWTNAWWSGSTVDIVAKYVLELIDSDAIGIHHVAGGAISKFDLLRLISKVFDLNLKVVEVAEPVINRILEPTTTIKTPLPQALKDLYTREANTCPFL